MSTLKLTGSSSGNAQVTVAAAAGTPTITLPTASINLATAGSDGQFLKTDGSGTLSFATVDSGLTYADQWRVTSTWSGGQEPLQNNWERVDSSGQGTIGATMAVSSGIWTFPATGVWWVEFCCGAGHSGDVRYAQLDLAVTTNNSSYADIGWGVFNMFDESGDVYGSAKVSSLVDVTDTANVKVRLGVQSNSGSLTFQGGTSLNMTYVTFIRLGDT